MPDPLIKLLMLLVSVFMNHGVTSCHCHSDTTSRSLSRYYTPTTGSAVDLQLLLSLLYISSTSIFPANILLLCPEPKRTGNIILTLNVSKTDT